MPERCAALLERLRRRPGRPPGPSSDAGAADPRSPWAAASGVAVRDLSVRFGGLDRGGRRCRFDAPLGRITGLIGPNGAGKTTTFDACSGLNRRIGGQVLLHGRDVTRCRPPAGAAPVSAGRSSGCSWVRR